MSNRALGEMAGTDDKDGLLPSAMSYFASRAPQGKAVAWYYPESRRDPPFLSELLGTLGLKDARGVLNGHVPHVTFWRRSDLGTLAIYNRAKNEVWVAFFEWSDNDGWLLLELLKKDSPGPAARISVSGAPFMDFVSALMDVFSNSGHVKGTETALSFDGEALVWFESSGSPRG